MSEKQHICAVEKAGLLDNRLRLWLQNPYKILKSFIQPGATVLEVGCGPGFFSIPIAKMLLGKGKLIAADMQEGMLEIIGKKVIGSDLAERIVLHKCLGESIGLNEQVDFVLAFYMVHEVPDAKRLITELKSLLKPDGQILIVEPKFHVKKKDFDALLEMVQKIGLKSIAQPKVFFSRSMLLKLA